MSGLVPTDVSPAADTGISMKLVLPSFLIAVAIGYARGGRLAALGAMRLRWPGLALLGLALQILLWPGGSWPLVYLYVSFAILATFAILNIRRIGFALILAGIALNFAVIVVNEGMPVSRAAIVASGQASSMDDLVNDGGAKHHLATEDDHVRFLGDVIAIEPLQQAISIGDVFTYGGVMVLIAASMGRRPRRSLVPAAAVAGEPGHVDR
jgi:hypothetical protein